MLFYFASVVSFLVIVSKFKPLPAWADEMRLLSLLLCQEFVCHSAKFLRKSSIVVISSILRFPSEMLLRKKLVLAPKVENVEPPEPMSVLDLPELVLECILARLSPAGLCNLGVVCCSLRDKCRSDHLWERHLRDKWGRVIGEAAIRDWQLYVDLRKDAYCRRSSEGKGKGWIWSLFSSWLKPKVDVSSKERNSLPLDSCMSRYLLLESGKFWFPAQVYNRENGHLGFLLSCYNAELSYDCSTDTFHARYPPHGRCTIVIEDGVPWDRIRAPPLDSPAHSLHPSDCLSDLRPHDHIEIQWRRNKGFPYGWWYGVVGHLESCSGDELYCLCPSNETVVLEFRQYAPGSQWRQTTVNRKDHREEGNETDGFYGGIRKLHNKEEISRWLRLWPAEVLE